MIVKNPTTAEHKQAFAGFVHKWQGILGLQDWRIVVTRKPARKGAMATADRSYPDRLASLSFGLDFGSTPIDDESLEGTAVHELLHVLLYELMEHCKNPDARDSDILSAEHRVVNVLEKLLLACPRSA